MQIAMNGPKFEYFNVHLTYITENRPLHVEKIIIMWLRQSRLAILLTNLKIKNILDSTCFSLPRRHFDSS